MFYLVSLRRDEHRSLCGYRLCRFRNETLYSIRIEDLAGLGNATYTVAALLSIFVFSVSGVPLTGGFVGKFYIFQAALNSHLVWLTVFGLMNSAVAAYYYLKIIVAIYMREPDVPTNQLEAPPASLRMAMWLTALGVLALGLFPSPLLQFATSSAASLTK